MLKINKTIDEFQFKKTLSYRMILKGYKPYEIKGLFFMEA